LNSDGNLKCSHKHYTQVQGQLAITDRHFCDFIVWTPQGMTQERIIMDIHFWEKVQRKLTSFFAKHLLPELITQAMNPSGTQEKVYCLCEERCKDTKMIACNHVSIQYVWFYFKCVGIKHAPEGTWFCPLCSSRDTV